MTAMAEAGCVEVSLGFESGSKQVLRAMNKQFEPEEVREISDRLVAHGIRRLGFLLLVEGYRRLAGAPAHRGPQAVGDRGGDLREW